MKTSLRREEVQHILKQGRRYARSGLVVCVLKGGGSGKFSILISKKVVKSAVARNRVRRVFREVVRNADYGCSDFVLLHNNKHSSEEEIKEDLKTLLKEVSGV